MSNSTSSTKDETALNSFINEKEELNQEISELKTNFTEPKNLINEKYLLSEDLKDCLFELNCENMVMKYSIKKIGKKEYKGNSNDIYTALNYYGTKDDIILKFIDFLESLKERIEEEYNKNYDFKLKLYFKGKSYFNIFKLDCHYAIQIKNMPEKCFVEKDILINGISDGFYLFLDYINSFED